VDDARQIDASAAMSAPKNAAKCLKGTKKPKKWLQERRYG
jgi:hypothetical protein